MRPQARGTAAEKAAVLAVVRQAQARTGWPLPRILCRLGISKSRYHSWAHRAAAEQLDDRSRLPRSPWAVLPEEVEAVIRYVSPIT